MARKAQNKAASVAEPATVEEAPNVESTGAAVSTFVETVEEGPNVESKGTAKTRSPVTYTEDGVFVGAQNAPKERGVVVRKSSAK